MHSKPLITFFFLVEAPPFFFQTHTQNKIPKADLEQVGITAKQTENAAM